MARDTVTPVDMLAETGADVSSPTTINVDNQAEIPYTVGSGHKIALHVKNTNVGAKEVTIVASDFGPRRGDGDLVVSVDADTGEELIVVNEDRFGQSDGFIHADFEAAMTGSIIAYELST